LLRKDEFSIIFIFSKYVPNQFISFTTAKESNQKIRDPFLKLSFKQFQGYFIETYGSLFSYKLIQSEVLVFGNAAV
jgi:hypothetical protein